MRTRIPMVLALPVVLLAAACARPASTPSPLAAERDALDARLAELQAVTLTARRQQLDALVEHKLLLELRAEELQATAEHAAVPPRGVANMQPASKSSTP